MMKFTLQATKHELLLKPDSPDKDSQPMTIRWSHEKDEAGTDDDKAACLRIILDFPVTFSGPHGKKQWEADGIDLFFLQCARLYVMYMATQSLYLNSNSRRRK